MYAYMFTSFTYVCVYTYTHTHTHWTFADEEYNIWNEKILDGITSRLEIAEENIGELEDKAIETT